MRSITEETGAPIVSEIDGPEAGVDALATLDEIQTNATIGETKELADQAEVFRHYARRACKVLAVQNHSGFIRALRGAQAIA